MAQYLKKGSKVYIEGKLQTTKWQDQKGDDRYTTEIVVRDMQMLDSRNSGESTQTRSAQPPQTQVDDGKQIDDFDEDLPF